MVEAQVSQFSLRARIGRHWFRWRGVSPLPFFILMVVLPPDFSWPGCAWIGVVLGILAAEFLRIWTVGYAGSSTRTRGDHVPDLVHAGPFRWVRNPLYLANIALYTLTALLFREGCLSLALLIYSFIQYSFIIAFEEELLERTFGSRYLAYKGAVPRWIPRSPPGIAATPQKFDLKKALRSERSTLLVMFVLLGVLLVRL